MSLNILKQQLGSELFRIGDDESYRARQGGSIFFVWKMGQISAASQSDAGDAVLAWFFAGAVYVDFAEGAGDHGMRKVNVVQNDSHS